MTGHEEAFEPITTEFDDRPLRYQTMGSILDARAEAIGDDPFLYYGPDGVELTFTETAKRANAIGTGLGKLDVKVGDNVGVIMKDPVATTIAMFGINKAGAVYAPINFELTGSALAYHVNDLDPAVLLVEDQFLENLNEVADSLDDTHRIVVHETNDGVPAASAGTPRASMSSPCTMRSMTPPLTHPTWIGLGTTSRASSTRRVLRANRRA
jgi:crotonobetaine/carnitine-CoA ligase